MPHQKISVPLSKLRFDPDNPRLSEVAGRTDDDIFREIVEKEQVDDLLSAISAGGLITGDPIIVEPIDGTDTYKVIEGNRRLATLRLLTGDRPVGDLTLPVVPVVTEDIKATFEPVEVETGWDENELLSYLGYKHVTSSKEWSPEAKARFVARHANGDYSDESLRVFARKVGTTLPTLKRWLKALLALEQLTDSGLFDPSKARVKRYFGTLYTLLASDEIGKFAGLSDDTLSQAPSRNIENLAQLVEWLAGSEANAPIIDSRSQKQLDQVLQSESATAYLRTQRDLDKALIYTDFKANEIAGQLRTAAYTVENCLPKLYDVREDAGVKEAFAELRNAMTKAQLNIEGGAVGA